MDHSQFDKESNQTATLRIPNREVREVFINKVNSWFKDEVSSIDGSGLFTAFETGNTNAVEEILSNILLDTISYYDYYENYYHGFLSGLLAGTAKTRKCYVESNRESGKGRSDIRIDFPQKKLAIIIETKAADSFDEMKDKCDEALQQLKEKKYAQSYTKRNYNKVLTYGISFYKKSCCVKLMDVE